MPGSPAISDMVSAEPAARRASVSPVSSIWLGDLDALASSDAARA
ncbi:MULTISPECIES: hypothetical protein [unclassified Phenylobacterium]|jgi:hypothetical protein|nr:hypothetical protein [Phenylobacterium sp. NIBR 498073]WGU42302.1 hypothetical protein O4N75_10105 [Phenylobacterium sp. NIBR 498073]